MRDYQILLKLIFFISAAMYVFYKIRSRGTSKTNVIDNDAVREQQIDSGARDVIDQIEKRNLPIIREKTICFKCANFKNLEPTGIRKDSWYNHVCTVKKLNQEINLVTGKKEYFGFNDLGGKYYTKEPYVNCKNANNGNCLSYRQKKRVKRVAK